MITIENKGEESMNILMVLSNPFTHDPRVYNEAKSLVNAKHKVTVLAWDKKKEHPSREVKDGIQIARSYNTKFMDLIPYDIFRMHLWWNKGYGDALQLHEENPFNVVHCHDFSALPIGIKLKKNLDVRLVYDAHEIWGYMVAKDLPKWWANYYFRKEKKLIRYVNKIIGAEDKYANYFNSITNDKLTTILNCKHLVSRDYIPPDNESFILLYIGSLSPTRFLLDLADIVKGLDGVKCIIGGIGRTRYVEKLKQKCDETDNIKFIGTVPPHKVVPMTQKCDAVVNMITVKNVNTRIATTNKQFEAMVCGRPIICTNGTRSGEITRDEDCGLVVDYTKEALSEAIVKLRDSPELCEKLGRNALKAAINKYNWEIEEKKLIKLYDTVKIAK
ncbi:MAG: glycosyltransferase family 4 protein [Thermoplasmatales archaeon]|nr:MAG: glycosyltransferase family 4 protein [Thermoplasmatales archaeon]